MRALELARRHQRGLSLVELMVGLVVAMMVGLAAASGAMMFASQQRQGVGTATAVSTATNALAALKEDAAGAGLGFFGDTSYLCKTLRVSVGTADRSQDHFAPLQVARSGSGDQLDLVSAAEVASGANVLLQSPSDTSSAKLATYLPVAAGQAVLLAPAPGAIDPVCTVRTVTDVTPATADSPLKLSFASSGAHNAVNFSSATQYLIKDRIALLGELQWHRYRLSGETLVIDQPLTDAPSATLLRNVVGFRVQYGIAGANGTTIESWQDPVGAWATLSQSNVAQVRALRIGIAARSQQPEKAGPDGQCHASDTRPSLLGTQLALGGNWQCFRYRTEMVTVPLRNLVMGMR
ncbi:MAG: PilW family protein [Burkholderiales bacterium]|jgi:type IV pilus assembly protein PilW|nr:PilW family protein [Burkholderiales bacterium]